MNKFIIHNKIIFIKKMAQRMNQLNKENNFRILVHFLLIYFQINIIYCQNCKDIHDLSNKTCFNDIITFDHDNWRSGHASINNNGDMIIEFSLDSLESDSRLFYGLKKNGRYYFPGEPVFREIKEMKCEDAETGSKYKGRFESTNLFVSLSNDAPKSKQYLFSMSSRYSLVELIDIENNLTYYAWNSTEFFGLTLPIFSFKFSLFELDNSNTYITFFSASLGYRDDLEVANTVTIQKFSLNSFNSNNPKQLINSKTINNYFSNRGVSAFQLGTSKIIVVMAMINTQYDPNDSNNKRDENLYNYCYLYFYKDDLVSLGERLLFQFQQWIWEGWGIFFKGITVKDDYFALMYYTYAQGRTLTFSLRKYIDVNNDNILINYNNFDIEFRSDVTTNEFCKLDDNRLIFLSTHDYNGDYGLLHMFLFYLYNNYADMLIREFQFYNPGYKFNKEVSPCIYNDYLLLSTALSYNWGTKAIIMIFGFANGTDIILDIYPYLMDINTYDESYNLYNYLNETIKIDNNIFGYEYKGEIILVSICDELLLYKGKLNIDKEENTFPLNELFDANYTLIQNKNKTKEEDKLYNIEYKFLVRDPDFDTFASMTTIKYGTVENYRSYYEPKIFEGRTNLLQFKLCHKFCKTCIEFGSSDNDQKCLTCKDQYTYDYLAYVNKFTGNCVPYDYMYDFENKALQYCNFTNYKYYYNETHSNERFCFKYEYECPDIYHYLNTTTNECLNYTLPTTIITTIPTTVIKPITTINNIIASTTPINIPIETSISPTTQIEAKISTNIPIETNISPTTQIETTKTTANPMETKISTNIPIEESKSTTVSDETSISTTIPVETTIPFIYSSIPGALYFPSQCKYGGLINHISLNLTSNNIYQKIQENIIPYYCINSSSVIIEGIENNIFQISDTFYEKLSSKNNNDNEIYAIDLSECENNLKDIYNITDNSPLIILKFLNENQPYKYEIYSPDDYEKLNLSYCENNTMDLYIPLKLDEKLEKIYNDLIKDGYNPFDLNDKFYKEICTPYTSENGTDVLLDDREEFIYRTLINYEICPDGCQFSEFNLKENNTKCECNIININSNNSNNEMVKLELDLKHLSGDNIYKSFLSTLRSTNYKVMRCYNLVFNLKYFRINYGSIITLIIFGIYIIFMLWYLIKGIEPFRLNISKLIFKETSKDNFDQINIIQYESTNKMRNKFPKKPKGEITNPPKKEKLKRVKTSRYSLNNNNKKQNNLIEGVSNNKLKFRETRKTSNDTLMN